MQYGEEDGPLDGKLEAPDLQQARQDFVDRAGLPESLEDQGRPDPGAASGDAVAPRMGAEDREFFREPSQRLNQRVKSAAGQQLIQAAETKQDALLDLAAQPLVIHDEQVSPGTVGLRANEQIGAPVSLSWPHETANNKYYYRLSAITRDTRISRLTAFPCVESTGCGHFASPSVEDESSPLAAVNSPVGVAVNGKSAELLAAVGYPGAVDGYQVNFRVPPDTPKGTATIQLNAAWIAGPTMSLAIP